MERVAVDFREVITVEVNELRGGERAGGIE
jgi:hypothetical protein